MFEDSTLPFSTSNPLVNTTSLPVSTPPSAPSTSHIPAISPNKGSKAYPMRQIFQVWYNNKDAILDVNVEVKKGESYRLAKPQQVYHLDLQHPEVQNAGASTHEDGVTDIVREEIDKPKVGLPPNLPVPNKPKPSEEMQLVEPQHIQWIYLDASGNEQGPFTGDVMQEWFSDGYLTPDLQIRRQEETNFQALKDFCDKVHNFLHPFSVPLPDLSREIPMANIRMNPDLSKTSADAGVGIGYSNASFGPLHQYLPVGNVGVTNVGANNVGGNNVTAGIGAANMRPSSSNLFDFMGDRPLQFQQLFGLNQNLGFGQLHMPSLLQQSIQPQQPQLARTSSWAMDLSIGGMGATNTADPIGMGLSPWLAGVQSVSRVSSPFVPEPPKAEDVLQDLHNSMVTGILNDDFVRPLPTVKRSAVETSFDLMASADHTPASDKNESQASTQVKDDDIPVSLVNTLAETTIAEPTAHAPQTPEVTKSIVSQPEDEVHVANAETTPVEKKSVTTTRIEAETTDSSKRTEEAAAVIAPWAKAAEAKPAVTLKQIQELEAERLEKERQMKAELKALMRLEANLASKEDKLPEKVAFNWANSNPQPTIKKTLAEIQKDEAEAAKAKAKTISAPKLSLADALSTLPKEEANAWTTVASKKPQAPKKATPMAYTPSGSSLNPLMLRAASANTLNHSSVNGVALREDFMVWARSAITNLYPSVSKDDLLEVFTTLPAHSDSVQLIAETIYSSSATMDGRRFAQEFMKKRQQVEKEVGNDGQSWSLAIASSANKIPTVDDDGWSTSVKSKKKGKRN